MNPHEPMLKPVAITDLRPTQITVGLHEVNEKRRHWRKIAADGGDAFLGRHMAPTVVGPRERHYIIDNHHLVRALHDAGVEEVLVDVRADLSGLSKPVFWRYLDNRAWCHPYDEKGRRVDFDDIPASIDKLRDDPYRSLAGDLRHAGGYAKDVTPFSEFLWADFLRGRIGLKAIGRDYSRALGKAVALAKSKDADYLPGWCGPDPIG
jgi:hypothetical protein